MRYDGFRYKDCRWCSGNGCLYCQKEADKAYAREFPDGLQPIATFRNTPEDLAAARETIGADAIKKAFGPDGGGLAEVLQNISRIQSKE